MRLEAQPLEGRFVRLEPFDEALRGAVQAALDVDPDAWAKLTVTGRGEAFDGWWDDAVQAQLKGARLPYAIRRLSDGRVVGASSYLHIEEKHRSVEIGATFLHPDARAGVVNPAAKRLLLAHAFDAGANRVELITDALNTRSQAAIAKLGAVREGTLRNHRVTWTGRVRDTVMFSITAQEWPKVCDGLDARLAAYG